MGCGFTPLARRFPVTNRPAQGLRLLRRNLYDPRPIMTTAVLPPPRSPLAGWIAFAALIAVGAVTDFLVRYYPAELPVWMPWEFSWPVFLLFGLTLGWWVVGLKRLAADERPALWRSAFFFIGVVAMYAVVQTHYDFLSQHMFFMHRFQHLVLHHLGPFLIALAASGGVVWAGMPAFLKRLLTTAPVRGVVNVIQNPIVAPLLFFGLIWMWLYPPLHVRVMLDENLYYLMNWTMAVDGIFFWCLVLDLRPKPPARVSPLVRALLTIIVVPPQILAGALLALSNRDVYPVYDICGRFFPISAISDQHYGGLILWIPGSMMSVMALILVLNTMRINDEKAAAKAVQ